MPGSQNHGQVEEDIVLWPWDTEAENRALGSEEIPYWLIIKKKRDEGLVIQSGAQAQRCTCNRADSC